MNKIIGKANGKEIEYAVNSAYEGLFTRTVDGNFNQVLGTGQFSDRTGKKLKAKIKRDFLNQGITGKVIYNTVYFTQEQHS